MIILKQIRKGSNPMTVPHLLVTVVISVIVCASCVRVSEKTRVCVRVHVGVHARVRVHVCVHARVRASDHARIRVHSTGTGTGSSEGIVGPAGGRVVVVVVEQHLEDTEGILEGRTAGMGNLDSWVLNT